LIGLHRKVAAAEPESRQERLAKLARRGTVFTLVGRGAGELLRFGSNLVLARLLFPEAFGLMAIVNAIAQGARMMTDLGVRGSIVRDERGADPVFVNTAWTIQIARGIAVALGLILTADVLAGLYGKPTVAPLIRVVALCAAIDGFTSTAVHALARQVRPGRQIARDLLARAIGIGVMICWALASPSVWALAAGAVLTSCAQVALSHRMLPGHHNSLAFERSAVRAIVGFGRWVLVATFMTFLLNQGDRLVLGKLMTSQELGVYAIAIMLAQAIPELTQTVATNVLFPVYARLRVLGPAEQRREVERYRLVIVSTALPVLWLLALAGPEIVGGLYDPRYAEAGWMLQVLSIGMIAAVISLSAERVLLARGDSFSHMLLQVSQALLLFVGMALGHALLGGGRGVIVGVTAGRLFGYLPLALLVSRTGLWIPRVDALAFGASGIVMGVGFALRGLP
jgi:O-antigen/teichoic acid export membrane protein